MNDPLSQNAKSAMAYSSIIAERLEVRISAPILFFAALRIVDPEQTILTNQKRVTALDATARYIKANGAASFESLVQGLINSVMRGDLPVIRLVDLLEAAAHESSTAIDVGLHAAGESLDRVLNLARQLAEERGDDGRAPTESPSEQPKYAVVIEGTAFRDDSNRFHTAEEAQKALEAFNCVRRGEAPPDDPLLVHLFFPNGLSEATSVSIEEL